MRPTALALLALLAAGLAAAQNGPPLGLSYPPSITGPAGATGAAGTHLASMLTANATNATASMAATGLSVPVTSGRKYLFRVVAFLEDSVAADGMALDFDTSAAATNFRAFAFIYEGNSGALLDAASLTALATDVASTGTGPIAVVIEGSYEPSANGNFLLRFAQIAHTVGTLTLYRGSSLILWEVP